MRIRDKTVNKLSLEISEGVTFDIEFGLAGATFDQRVEAAREALVHLLWRFAEAKGEPCSRRG